MDNFKIILEAMIDNSSLSNVQKQLAKERLKVSADIDFSNFVSEKQKIQQLANEINKILGDSLKPKEALNWANQYWKQMQSGAIQAQREQEKLNQVQKKSSLATQEKYYQRIINNNKTIYSLKEKLLRADEKQSQEIQNQITKLEKRNQYNYGQLSKKGLTDNSWEWEVNTSKEVLENRLRINQEKQKDVALSKQIADVDRIQHLSNTGTFAKQVSDATVEYNKLSTVTDGLKTDFAELQKLQTALGTSQTDEELISNYEKFNTTLEKVKNSMHVLANEQKQAGTYNSGALAEQKKIDSLAESVLKFRDNNTKMSKDLKRQFTGIYDSLINDTNLTEKQVGELSKEFINLKLKVREAGQLGQSFGDKMKNAFQKFSEWGFATGIVTEIWQGFKRVYDEALKLDDVITDLTMATDLSASQIESLVDKYSDLGEDLNATTSDMIASGTEWIKQGQSIADTEKLITSAMVLDKVGKLENAQATEYLTSTMKGYKVSVEDTMDIVDKLSAVDMASATDVGGLAEAMSQVANNANLAGVSMDKLIGYIAVIGETTGEGMSSVGTGLNAIFSRMGNIKLSRLKDYQNNGEDLSNVETVLRGEGIVLRDSANEFRNFGKVLDEVAGRWTSFSEVSQRAIASAFAGTNHMEQFMVLMEGYGKATEYTEKSLNSSGEAMQKFEDYQKSVTAHTELFNKSIQDLANTAIDSGLVNFFIDLGTGLVKFLDGTVNLLTPLGTLGVTLGGILGANDLG